MDEPQGQRDPDVFNKFVAGAANMKQMFDAFVTAGFEEDQALRITAYTVVANATGDEEEEKKT